MRTAAHRGLSSGRVMVELIMVLPLMIMIPAVIFEVCNFMQYTQAASFASGQAALVANRQCADFFTLTVESGALNYDADSAQTRTRRCLAGSSLSTLAQQAAGYLPSEGFSLVVSIYRFNPGENLPDAGAPLELLGRFPTMDSVSRFAVASGPQIVHSSGAMYPKANGQILVSRDDVIRRRRIVIAEVSYRYRPRVPIVEWLVVALSGGADRRLYREVTVL